MPEDGSTREAVDIQGLKEIMDNDRELIQGCFAEFIYDLESAGKKKNMTGVEKNFQP